MIKKREIRIKRKRHYWRHEKKRIMNESLWLKKLKNEEQRKIRKGMMLKQINSIDADNLKNKQELNKMLR